MKENHTANALLLRSCAEGSTKKAEIALNYGANVNYQDRYGIRPFLVSVQNCDHAMIDLLLHRGADPRCIGSDDLYPMAHIAMMDKVEVLESIGAHCWDTEAPSSLLPSALEHAFSAGKTQSIQCLIRHGADIHAMSLERKNLLTRQVEMLNTTAINQLKTAGALWFQKDKENQNAIDYASYMLCNDLDSKDSTAFEFFCEWAQNEPLIDPTRLFCIQSAFSFKNHSSVDNEDVQYEQKKHGVKKLLAIKKKKSREIFFHWLKPSNYKVLKNTKKVIHALHQAELTLALALIESTTVLINARDQNGFPLAHLAIQAAEKNKVHLNKSSSSNNLDSDSVTIKFAEIEDTLTKILESLSKKGANEYVVDSVNGNNIGHELISGSFASIYFKLYDQGLFKETLNRSNFKQDRLLHIAVRRRDIKSIDSLLQRSCDRNPVNKDGHTPLHHCALHVDSEIASRLISAGANYNLSTRRGQSIKTMLENIGKKANAFHALLQTRESLQKVMGIFSHDNPMTTFVKSCMGNFKRST